MESGHNLTPTGGPSILAQMAQISQIQKLQQEVEKLKASMTHAKYDTPKDDSCKKSTKYYRLEKKVLKLTRILNDLVIDLQTTDFSLDSIRELEQRVVKTQTKIRTEFDMVTVEVKKNCECDLTSGDVKKIKDSQYREVVRELNKQLLDRNSASRSCGKTPDMAQYLKSYYEERGLLFIDSVDGYNNHTINI